MTSRRKTTGVSPSTPVPQLWGSDREIAADLSSLVKKTVTLAQKLDEEKEWLSVRAPNCIEYIVGKRYADQPSLFEHWGAYRLVKEFFELRCPVCNVGENAVPADPWGLSRETMESEILLVWTPKHEDDACPKCGTTRAEFIEDGLMRGHRVLHAIIGQRGGKSTTLGFIGGYIEHVICTIDMTYPGGFHRYLGIPKGDLLHMTFVASTDTQAKETVWAKYRGLRALSPWFKRYIPWVKGQEKIQDTPKGMQRWEYSEADKSIKNGMLGLYIDSLNSNSNGLAGRTRVAAVIDEICRMEQTESSRSAQEVYRTMDASCQTVQSLVEQHGLVSWLGMIASISSPIAAEDYGMQLLHAAERDKKMFAVKLATWDFNPKLPKSFFADLLRKDHTGTMRNFGAMPPGAANPLIDRPKDFLESVIDWGRQPIATFTPYEFEDQTGHLYIGSNLEHADLLVRDQPRFIAADAGKNFDAFSVACAHAEKDKDDNVITVFDWVIRILTLRRKQEVYFESIFQIMQELTRYVVINQIEFDHWNSTHIIQRLRNELGVRAEEVATKDEHFIRFMRDAYSGYVKMLPPQPDDDSKDPPFKSAPAAALYELLHLERDPKNDKVFNPRKGLRKGWDCLVAGTPVVMVDGSSKAVETVQVGECVIDGKGQAQTVEAAWCSGTPPELVELDVYGRGTIRTTANHKWPVWAWPRTCACGCGESVKPGRMYVSGHHGGRGQGQDYIVVLGNQKKSKNNKKIPVGYDPIQLLHSDEIRPGDFLMIPRTFEQVETDTSRDRARLLGYYAAEGWIAANGRRIDFGFAEKERETWVRDVVGLLAEEGLGATIKHMPCQVKEKRDDPSEGGITIWSTNDQGRVDSSILASWLVQNARQGSREKKFSEDVMRWPLDLKKELIKGLFRGDGCQSWSTVGETNGKVSRAFAVQLGVSSEVLRDQVELILAQLGFPSRRSTGHHTQNGTSCTCYYLKVPAPWAEGLADLIWGEQSKAREHERGNPTYHRCMVDENFVYVPVKAVRKVSDVEPVYNLTISGDHTYLVKNVATHNSDDTARVIVHAHRLVQDQGYTVKQDDVSRAARRKRAEAGMAQWAAQGRGRTWKAPQVGPNGGRGW